VRFAAAEMRTPLSKQRNKHIQHVLVEAAKLAPRRCHELAAVYKREKQKGNAAGLLTPSKSASRESTSQSVFGS